MNIEKITLPLERKKISHKKRMPAELITEQTSVKEQKQEPEEEAKSILRLSRLKLTPEEQAAAEKFIKKELESVDDSPDNKKAET